MVKKLKLVSKVSEFKLGGVEYSKDVVFIQFYRLSNDSEVKFIKDFGGDYVLNMVIQERDWSIKGILNGT